MLLDRTIETDDQRRVAGIAIPPQILLEMMKPGHHPGYSVLANYVPEDAEFVRADFDIVTTEILILFRSDTLPPTQPGSYIAFPWVGINVDENEIIPVQEKE